jgi:hypothetical protein
VVVQPEEEVVEALEPVDDAPIAEPPQTNLSTLLDALEQAGSPEALTDVRSRLRSEWMPLDADALRAGRDASDLSRALARMHEDLDRDSSVTYGLTQLTSTALIATAGAVSWLLRTSSLATSLLTSLPAWVRFDPLPVLEDENPRGDEDEEFEAWREDRELDDLFELAPPAKDAGSGAEGTRPD